MSEDEVQAKAILIVEAIYGELSLGTKHYSRATGEMITSPIEIIRAMKDSDLIFEPTPERQWLFQKIN